MSPGRFLLHRPGVTLPLIVLAGFIFWWREGGISAARREIVLLRHRPAVGEGAFLQRGGCIGEK